MGIVWGRVLFASISFLLFFLIRKQNPFKAKKGFLFKNFLIGALLAFHWCALLAFHWWSFYQSVQLSSVALGLFCFSTFPVFTVFLEPLFSNSKIEISYFVFAILSILGIYILLPEFSWHNKDSLAIFWGILSGLSFALLTIFNGLLSKQYSAEQLAFLQDFSAFLCLSPFILMSSTSIEAFAWMQLLLLGTVFTALAHVLFVSSLKTINAQAASIIANLEPIYGVLFAYVLLNEKLSIQHILGGSIIIIAAILSTWKPGKQRLK